MKPVHINYPLPEWPIHPGERETYKCDVITAYNRLSARWLHQSVNALLNQNWADCTIHLIRDDSPIQDDPAEHLVSLSSRVRWYATKEVVGPYVCVHQVWKYLVNDFVAIQDSDDIPHPNRIWYSIESLMLNNADFLSAAMEQFIDHESSNERVNSLLKVAPTYFPGAKGGRCPGRQIVNGTFVFRKDAFERVNGYLPLYCSADGEIPIRIRRLGMKILDIPHALALQRLHESSLSNGEEWGAKSENRKRVWTATQSCIAQYDDPNVDLRSFGGLEEGMKSDNLLDLNMKSKAHGHSDSFLEHYEKFYDGSGWETTIQQSLAEKKIIVKEGGWWKELHILDLGCGEGTHTEAFRRLGFNTTGIDISTVAIEKAQQAYPEPDFIAADLAKWHPQTSPDIIYCRGMSWYHYELDAINRHGINVSHETARFFSWLPVGGRFVLQIATDLSGTCKDNGILNNTLFEYIKLFSRFGQIETLSDWTGNPIMPNKPVNSGIVITTRKGQC